MKKSLFILLVGSAVAASFNANAFDVEAKYKQTCFACHGTGAAGSPKVHDTAAWEPRLAQGIDTLLSHVKSGKNAMPPGGLCTDCSDDDYKALIKFMSSKQ